MALHGPRCALPGAPETEAAHGASGHPAQPPNQRSPPPPHPETTAGVSPWWRRVLAWAARFDPPWRDRVSRRVAVGSPAFSGTPSDCVGASGGSTRYQIPDTHPAARRRACPPPARGRGRECTACMAGRYAESSGQPMSAPQAACEPQDRPSNEIKSNLPPPPAPHTPHTHTTPHPTHPTHTHTHTHPTPTPPLTHTPTPTHNPPPPHTHPHTHAACTLPRPHVSHLRMECFCRIGAGQQPSGESLAAPYTPPRAAPSPCPRTAGTERGQ